MPQQMQIKPMDGYLHVEVSGTFDAGKAKEFIQQIVKAVDRHGLFDVLVDIRKIDGHIPTSSRFALGTFLGEQWSVLMRLAILESPGQVEDQRFFENVAVNRGAQVKTFTTTSDEALEWLAIKPSNK